MLRFVLFILGLALVSVWSFLRKHFLKSATKAIGHIDFWIIGGLRDQLVEAVLCFDFLELSIFLLILLLKLLLLLKCLKLCSLTAGSLHLLKQTLILLNIGALCTALIELTFAYLVFLVLLVRLL